MPLTLWIDPSDDNVVTVVGSPETGSPAGRITAIADKSLSGNDVSENGSPESGPLVTFDQNSRRAMRFEAGDFLRRVNASPDLFNMGGPDFTVVVACSDDGAAGAAEGLIGVSGSASPLDNSGWRIDKPTGSPQMRIVGSVGDPATNFVDLKLATSPEGFVGVVAMSLDQTGNYIAGYRDGVETAVDDFTGTLGFANDLNIGFVPGGASWVSGDIFEVVYSDTLLRSDERQRIEGYLAHKWALTDGLPTGHPFKTQAPDIVDASQFVANFNGADTEAGGSPEYLVETGQVATFVGTAQLDTAQFKYGTASLKLDGNSDRVGFPSDDPSFEYDATVPLTVEAWIYLNALPGASDFEIINYGGLSGSSWANWSMYIDTTDVLSARLGDSGSPGVSIADINGNTVLSAGQWYHVAVVFDTVDIRLYLDGVLDNTPSAHGGTPGKSNANGLTIGDEPGNAVWFNGWIDGTRVVLGKDLYPYNFTPPHRGFVVPVPAAFLMNFNGDDAASSPPSFTSEDAVGHVGTVVSTAQLATAQKKFGKSSLLLNGTSDKVTFPDHADFKLDLVDDMTVEAWVRKTSDTARDECIFNKGGISGTAWPNYILQIDSTGVAEFAVYRNGSVFGIASGTTNLANDTWYHVCGQYTAATLDVRIFVNGVSEGSATGSGTPYSTNVQNLEIGEQNNAGQWFPGYIDGARITRALLYSPAGFDVPIDAPGEPII